METMTKEGKVTVKDLRELRNGESATFRVPEPGDVVAARSLASLYGKIDGVSYSTSCDISGCMITITRKMTAR